MELTWYGTASIVLRSQDTVLAFDPFMKDLPEGMESEQERSRRAQALCKQKTILITHGHFDHIASIPLLYKDEDCVVYATKTPCKTLKRKGFAKEKLRLVQAGDSLSFGNVTVRAKRGRHVAFNRKEIADSFVHGNIKDLPRALHLSKAYLAYPEKGETLVFEIEAEGKTVTLMGSAGLCEGETYAKGADVLILPHQGRGDIDEVNAEIVKLLQPKRVLLDHYDNAFPPFSKDVETADFVRRLAPSVPACKLVEWETVEL